MSVSLIIVSLFQRKMSFNHVSTQTDFDVTRAVKPEPVNDTSWDKKTLSVEEMVKEAAEDAMKQTGFVYDEASGLYYDYNTGYYYNAVSNHFFVLQRSYFSLLTSKIIIFFFLLSLVVL